MRDFSPIPDTFTTLVASREFELSHGAGTEKVTIEIGLPVNDVQTFDGCDWRCPVRISVGNTITTDNACGVDSVQALGIAVNQLVKVKLESIAQDNGAKILLYGQEYNFEY